MTGNNTKAECSHYQALPTHYVAAFRNHALFTKERTVSPFDFTPEFQEFCTAHPKDRVLSSRTDAFSTQSTGFSISHPMYDAKHMLKEVQHATTSALNNQEATTTFLLLPRWMESNTNAFHKNCIDNYDVCTMHYAWKYPKDKSAR